METGNSDAVKAILLALIDRRYTWRSIDALTKASGLSATDTRVILKGIGAVRNSGSAELYTVKFTEGVDSIPCPEQTEPSYSPLDPDIES